MRSSAVLAVFVAHVTHCVGGPEHAAYTFVEAIGRFGVILFFLHTSLVLMLSMDRTALEPAFVARFYVRRAFRIYPLSILAVTATFVLRLPPNAWSRLHYDPIGISQLVSNLLLVQNLTQRPPVLSPLWSLPLEVQMYAVLPFLFLLVRFGNWRLRLLTCLGIAVSSAWVVWGLTGKLNIFAFIPCFLAGVMAYKRAGRKRTLPAWIWVVLIPGMLLSVSALPFYERHFLRPISICTEWAAVWALGFAWSKFSDVSWEPVVRVAAQVAKYSYGIYLAHTYAFYICFAKFKTSPAIGVFLATLITAAMAVLAYHLVEQPLINVGKRVAAHIGGSWSGLIPVPQIADDKGSRLRSRRSGAANPPDR
jgi:peptidoglycan/LPS O-acetylase OafA/YrhL